MDAANLPIEVDQKTGTQLSNDSPHVKYCKVVLRKLYITKGARFTAHRRLETTQSASLWTQVILSIFLIGSSTAPTIMAADFNRELSAKFSLFSVMCAVFILTLNLIEYWKSFALRSMKMLKSGNEITTLHDQLQHALHSLADRNGAFSDAALQELSQETRRVLDRYDRIMLDNSDNHANIDFLYFIAIHKKEAERQKLSSADKWRFWFHYHTSVFASYILMLAGALLALRYILSE